MNHRGGEIGTYSFAATNGTAGKMFCQNPYPCEFDRGIITAMARRFSPGGSRQVCVEHDDEAPCRKQGAESCTYHVRW